MKYHVWLICCNLDQLFQSSIVITPITLGSMVKVIPVYPQAKMHMLQPFKTEVTSGDMSAYTTSAH